MAQGYPTKPVKFIVPYAAGGLPDSVARVVAQRLTERLGQSVVVDNKPGGNGVVAYQALLQSSPQDGHAFIVSDGSMLSITPLLNKAVPYKVGTDILPVSLIARSPLFVVAHPKNGVNTLQEFVSLVKRKPGEYTYGSSGIGSTHHLTMEALKAALNLDVRHVPFKGSGQSTPALVGGQVDFSVAALPSMLGFAKAGQVKFGIGQEIHQAAPMAVGLDGDSVTRGLLRGQVQRLGHLPRLGQGKGLGRKRLGTIWANTA
jgi:tripartite-type tricarboxylate transporter receptor subunit TctC